MATSTAKAHASANALSPGLADALLNLRGKHQDNGQLVTGLAQSDGVFLGAGQANQAVRNMQEEDEIYSGPTGLTARGRNIHSLRKDLQTGCEPDAEQRNISTVLSHMISGKGWGLCRGPLVDANRYSVATDVDWSARGHGADNDARCNC